MKLLLLGLLLADAGELSVVDQVAQSGRYISGIESPDDRVSPPTTIAPGAPPLLSFRLYEGKQHGRFGNADLMLDDACH